MIVRAGPPLVQPEELEARHDPVAMRQGRGDEHRAAGPEQVVARLPAVHVLDDLERDDDVERALLHAEPAPITDIADDIRRGPQIHADVARPPVGLEVSSDPTVPAANLDDTAAFRNGIEEVAYLACARVVAQQGHRAGSLL